MILCDVQLHRKYAEWQQQQKKRGSKAAQPAGLKLCISRQTVWETLIEWAWVTVLHQECLGKVQAKHNTDSCPEATHVPCLYQIPGPGYIQRDSGSLCVGLGLWYSIFVFQACSCSYLEHRSFSETRLLLLSWTSLWPFRYETAALTIQQHLIHIHVFYQDNCCKGTGLITQN